MIQMDTKLYYSDRYACQEKLGGAQMKEKPSPTQVDSKTLPTKSGSFRGRKLTLRPSLKG